MPNKISATESVVYKKYPSKKKYVQSSNVLNVLAVSNEDRWTIPKPGVYFEHNNLNNSLLPFLEHQSTSVNQIYLQLGEGRGVPVGWVVKQLLVAEN